MQKIYDVEPRLKREEIDLRDWDTSAKAHLTNALDLRASATSDESAEFFEFMPEYVATPAGASAARPRAITSRKKRTALLVVVLVLLVLVAVAATQGYTNL